MVSDLSKNDIVRKKIKKTKKFNSRLDHAWDRCDWTPEHANKIMDEIFQSIDKFLAENGMAHLRDYGRVDADL